MTGAPSGDPQVVLLDPSSFTPYYDAKLAGALACAGWSVEWITSRWEFEDVPAPPDVALRHAFFAALHREPLARLVNGPRRGQLRRALKGLLYPLDALRVARLLRRRAPGVLHVQWAHLPWLDARLWRTLRRDGWIVVHTIHDIEPLAGSSPGPVPWSARALRAAADAIVVHDDVARAALLARGVRSDRVHVVAPGGPIEPAALLDRAAARAQLGLAPDAPVVLFLGFVKPYKGLGVLLESVARLRDALPGLVLLIAGEPTAGRGAYDRAIARLGLAPQVRWSGTFVPSEALGTYLAAADVVALPYLEASSSGVLLAAYAHGRPVVATAVGGLPALIEHERTGLLVPPRDPDALAHALRALLDDPARAACMGEAARARWQQGHGWPRVAAAHGALYRTLWAARGDRAFARRRRLAL